MPHAGGVAQSLRRPPLHPAPARPRDAHPVLPERARRPRRPGVRPDLVAADGAARPARGGRREPRRRPWRREPRRPRARRARQRRVPADSGVRPPGRAVGPAAARRRGPAEVLRRGPRPAPGRAPRGDARLRGPVRGADARDGRERPRHGRPGHVGPRVVPGRRREDAALRARDRLERRGRPPRPQPPLRPPARRPLGRPVGRLLVPGRDRGRQPQAVPLDGLLRQPAPRRVSARDQREGAGAAVAGVPPGHPARRPVLERAERARARDRRDRLRQVDDARRHHRREQPRLRRPHRHHRQAARVRPPPRPVHHPAPRGRPRRPVVQGGREPGAPAGPRHHHDRGDARPRDHRLGDRGGRHRAQGVLDAPHRERPSSPSTASWPSTRPSSRSACGAGSATS